jgi:hypothetical protein
MLRPLPLSWAAWQTQHAVVRPDPRAFAEVSKTEIIALCACRNSIGARIVTRRSACTEHFLSLTLLSNVVAYACRHSREEDRQMATPDNRRSPNGSIANSPGAPRGLTSWARLKYDGRKGRKGRKALAPVRRGEFVNDFNHRDGPVSATRRGRKVAESAGKSLQELCARNCPLFSCLTLGVQYVRVF